MDTLTRFGADFDGIHTPHALLADASPWAR